MDHADAIIAAIVPCVYTFIQGKTLRKEFRTAIANTGKQFDKSDFHKNKGSLIKDLKNSQKDIVLGANDWSTLVELSVLLTRAEYYSQSIGFIWSDKKAIKVFRDDINKYLDTNNFDVSKFNWNTLPSRIEKTINILNKGRYRVYA